MMSDSCSVCKRTFYSSERHYGCVAKLEKQLTEAKADKPPWLYNQATVDKAIQQEREQMQMRVLKIIEEIENCLYVDQFDGVVVCKTIKGKILVMNNG